MVKKRKDIPNTSKSMSKDKCQSILWNLLELFEVQDSGKQILPSSSIVRAILQTERCDGFTNVEHDSKVLKNMRESVVGFINDADSNAMDDILSYTPSQKSETIATDAMIHYRHYTKVWCSNCLNWPNYLHYQIIFKGERTLYVLGLPTAILGSYGALMNSKPTLSRWYQYAKDLKK